MTGWYTMPFHVPADGQQCWLRLWWYINPFKGYWRSATQSWELDHGLLLPWWTTARWKAV